LSRQPQNDFAVNPKPYPGTEWTLEDDNFDPARIVLNGSKYIVANGYMGYRGTLEEFRSEQFTGNIMAGLYDKVGDGWREPVNAPNALFTRIVCNGTPLSVLESTVESHRQTLDIKHAMHCRRTTFVAGGQRVELTAERFLSMDQRHLLLAQFSVRTDQAASIEIETGTDLDIWDTNGPHLEAFQVEETDGILITKAKTHELGREICLAEALEFDGFTVLQAPGKKNSLRMFAFSAEPGRVYRFWKFVAIFTGNDAVPSVQQAASGACAAARAAGYPALLKAHAEAWERRWDDADVQIEGDNDAQFALRYNLYHLLAISPPPDKSLSIPARGLSGQVYKGACFWDTEMFMLPFFLSVEPETARNLLLYRVRTLDGARRKAREYGYEGAFYAWESQETGDDACTHFNVSDVFTGRPMRTYFRDKQIHISAAVAHGLWKYYAQTGDERIFTEGGAEVILECARFYSSHAYYKAAKRRYEFLDVVGPDEYHERVNNNAYTNRMALETFRIAQRVVALLEAGNPSFLSDLIQRLSFESLLAELSRLCEQIYLPVPARDTGVIPQFDGYQALEDVFPSGLKSRLLNPNEYLGGGHGLATVTQVLKQADVVLMLSLFGDDYSPEVRKQNWAYYEPRTEHGSSLSACAYGIVACEIGELERAYQFFLQTATIDLTGKSKQFLGSLYIGGTHPAANGGAWMVAVRGFAGLRLTGEGLSLDPRLPGQWRKMCFRVHWRGLLFRISISPEEVQIEGAAHNSSQAAWRIAGEPVICPPGQTITHRINHRPYIHL
jgi:trehalose/maltose hydrolase-like predicted phosphorylase